MAELNTKEWLQRLPKTTVHSEIYGAFQQNEQGQILSVSSFDPNFSIEIAYALFDCPSTDKDITRYFRRKTIRVALSVTASPWEWYIYHRGPVARPNYGLIFRVQPGQPDLEPLRDYAAYLMLNGLRFMSPPKWLTSVYDNTYYELQSVTRIFEAHLLFDAFKKEGWQAGGQCKFYTMLKPYFDEGLPIEMALPAFPCKTTNPEKAAVSMPDGAEFEALSRLQAFCKHVKMFYSAGCFINIVSDGHVFADCQGTDDDIVTAYNFKLKLMNKHIRSINGSPQEAGIKFHDLGQLLCPEPQELSKDLLRRVSALSPIKHPVKTQINPADDHLRKLMLEIWSPPPAFYRDLIKQQPDHAITALYRGFSRFMFEDLAHHSNLKEASISQRKKTAESVACTMIQRNQTYSRLVEAVFPSYVRLSIHAHDNSGPKYAVRVLPWEIQYAENVPSLTNHIAKSLSAYEETSSSRQTLHIPTPWHNTLADIYYRDDITQHKTFLLKAKLAVELIESGSMNGGYDRHHPRGGRFVLWHKHQPTPYLPRGPEDLWISVDDFRLEKSLDITELIHGKSEDTGTT